MELITKQVDVELHTVIDDQGEKEISVIKQKGSYYQKGDLEVITFTDQAEGIGEIKNSISIHPDKLTVKRSGAVSMNQQFKAKMKSECLYRHPYGMFHMELYTHKITKEKIGKNGAGKVSVEYEVHMNGQAPRYHYLTLTYMEEK